MPLSWVAADSVHGVGDIEMALRRAGKGYVLGISAKHAFNSWGKPYAVVGTARDIAAELPPEAWQRLSLAQEPRESAFMTGPISNWPISMLRESARSSVYD